MANLVEIPIWEPGIYQFEQEDVVLGGPDGLDNLPGKQLANRTQYLKEQIELAQGDMTAHLAAADPHPQYLTETEGSTLIAAAVAALVNSSPATLDTLAELATALGNDPNFSTTLTNLLALKAPLASPALTGTPSAPTPAQFNNSALLATTEFFAKNSGRMAGNEVISGAATMTGATHAGKIVQLSGTGPFTVILPLASEIPVGGKIKLVCTATGTITISRQGANQIYPLLNSPTNSFTMLSGDEVMLEQAGGLWAIVEGSIVLGLFPQFGSLLGANGYQKLPSGLILQWGQNLNVSSTQGAVTIPLPIAFPNACLNASATLRNSTSSGAMEWGTQIVSFNQTQLVLFNQIYPNSSGTSFDGYYWLALGY